MEKLEIYTFQAKLIEDALRLAIRTLNSRDKTSQSSMDRDLLQAEKMIKNAIAKTIDQHVTRF
jgi:hypothetical protein